jgi:hypothetical protein
VDFVGPATVLVILAETRVLTDPVLRSRVALLRRVAPDVREGCTETST